MRTAVCPNCETSLSPQDNFCTKCGTKRASNHERHAVHAALLGGALGIFIGWIGETMTAGLAAALAPCGGACDHTDQAVILIFWFTALAFGGGILSALASPTPRLAGVMMLAVAGGLLALVVLAYIHLNQSTADSLSGGGLFFGMIPPLIFLWGGFQTGVISLLPHSYLERSGNRMMARAKSWRRP